MASRLTHRSPGAAQALGIHASGSAYPSQTEAFDDDDASSSSSIASSSQSPLEGFAHPATRATPSDEPYPVAQRERRVRTGEARRHARTAKLRSDEEAGKRHQRSNSATAVGELEKWGDAARGRARRGSRRRSWENRPDDRARLVWISRRTRRTAVLLVIVLVLLWWASRGRPWTASLQDESMMDEVDAAVPPPTSRPPSRPHGGTQLDERFTRPTHHCDFCDCSADRSHPPLKDPVSGEGGRLGRNIMAKTVWSGIREVYCRRVYIPSGTTARLLRRSTLNSPSLLGTMQWNLTASTLGLPTAYVYTKTSSSGRTGPAREGYMRRHLSVMRNHLLEMRNEGWPAESDHVHDNGRRRQMVWIVVEDEDKLSEDIAELLAASDVPYIYFAFGPTRHFGNAQQNAAYTLIHKLSSATEGLFGHGPVVSVDDDASVLPELFKMVWKVQRVGVWPMGNLGPTTWEGPEFDEKGKLVAWPAGATSERAFPIDNGAFAFRSELLGEEIPGPMFWPTNMMGGESEFLAKLVKTKEEIEPLCHNCHVAWHNQPLPAHCIDEACE